MISGTLQDLTEVVLLEMFDLGTDCRDRLQWENYLLRLV